MAKKSYNPFKMWGSYVGALLGYLMGVYTMYGLVIQQESINIFALLLPFTQGWNTAPIMPIIFISMIIIGFLIGWGIHSLVRKLRK